MIMASALVKQVMGKLPHEVVKTEMGSALVGRKYQPLFNWYVPPASSRPASVPPASSRPESENSTQKNPTLETGYHRRGYLPHFKQLGATYFVTFRIAGTLPKHVYDSLVEKARTDIANLGELSKGATVESVLSTRIDDSLDSSKERQLLKDPAAAELVENALKHFDGERYELHAWAVMSNHVHAVVTPKAPHTLSEILHSWKSFTSNKVKALLSLGSEPLWQHESYDRLIRDEDEFIRFCEYTVNNPLKAGLTDWRFAGVNWDVP